MKTMIKTAFAVLGLLAIASCTTFEMDGLTYTTNDMPGVTTLGAFETTVWVNEFLGPSGGANLLNLSSDAMNDKITEAIREEIKALSGDAAINVKITYQASFLNLVLNSLTSTIWSPATAIITGTVVSYN